MESQILSHDPRLVGAYDIVPLSGIAAAFSGWDRRLNWLRRVCVFIEGKTPAAGRTTSTSTSACSGAKLLDFLRVETRTGWGDVEAMALDLVAVAEKAWLRELAGWVLYGRLPARERGGGDFMVQAVPRTLDGAAGESKSERGHAVDYVLAPHLCPDFVAEAARASILFVGKSLALFRSGEILGLEGARGANGASSVSGIGVGGVGAIAGSALLKSHLSQLSALTHPISSTSLTRAVAAIRTELAQKALKQLLPLSSVLRLLGVLRDFFLLGRGEFAVALVSAADECLARRHLRAPTSTDDGASGRSADVARLGGVMIKEGEVTGVLDRTWATLAAAQDMEDEEGDEEMEFAREVIRLEIKRRDRAKMSFVKEAGGGNFDDALLSTPTILALTVASPLNLFLTPSEVDIYSAINAYLLSIRRAHLHLSGLWKLSVLRRIHPAPARPTKFGDPSVRKTTNQRNLTMRTYWAAISSAVFFLTELGGYFHGEVILESWKTFRDWIEPKTEQKNSNTQERDPENLTSAHRVYLKALVDALLLDDTAFTTSTRAFLIQCDQIIALITRLNAVEQTLQVSERVPKTAGEGEVPAHMRQEEEHILRTLTGVTHGIALSTKELSARLNTLDQERLGDGFSRLQLNDAKLGELGSSNHEFVPWRSGGVKNLLMRLDFRTILDD